MIVARGLVLLCFVVGLTACAAAPGEEEGSGGSGAGGSGAGGSGAGGSGGAPGGSGTCASTCARAVAAGCASGPSDAGACTQECNGQQADCASMAAEFQTYLDCLESTAFECGTTTGTASAPACVGPGLAILPCTLGGGGAGGGGGAQAAFDIVALATGLENPVGVAAHGGEVFVTVAGAFGQPQGTVQRVDAAGLVSTVATAQHGPSAIAADDSGVYWLASAGTNQGQLLRVPAGGAAVETVASGLRSPLGLALAPDALYFLDGQSRDDTGFAALLARVTKDGSSAPEPLHNHTEGLFHLAPATEGVYIASQTTGLHLVAPGGAVTDFAGSSGAYGIALDDGHVYVTISHSSDILRYPRGGGASEAIVAQVGLESNEHPFDLGLDATHVWFLTQRGAITRLLRVPKAGGTVEDTGAVPGYYNLPDLAVDASGAYVLDQTAGTLFAVRPAAR